MEIICGFTTLYSFTVSARKNLVTQHTIRQPRGADSALYIADFSLCCLPAKLDCRGGYRYPVHRHSKNTPVHEHTCRFFDASERAPLGGDHAEDGHKVQEPQHAVSCTGNVHTGARMYT